MTTEIWLRHEQRPDEHRAPLVPADVERLVAAGARVTVEESPQRAFPIEEYVAAGAVAAPAGGWTGADPGCYVLGLKELPESDAPLRHRHVMFGHAFGGQRGATALLSRFAAGGGTLLDLEFLVDDAGRRLVAFGYWAGYAGAALGVLHAAGRLTEPLRPTTRAGLDAALRAADPPVTALVVGALGRCGQGAGDALAVAGAAVTRWDVEETRRLDRAALLAHDVLVNAVRTERPQPPLLTPDDLTAPGRALRVVVDVTCDVTSDRHLLPVYDRLTTWDDPVRRVGDGPPPVDVVAIDNLPSLLPAEASTSFSAQLAPLLARLADDDSPWERARRTFHEHLEVAHA